MPKKIPTTKKTSFSKPAQKNEIPIPVTVEKIPQVAKSINPVSQTSLVSLATEKASSAGQIKKTSSKRLWLRWLAVVFIVVGLAVIIYPLWPEIQFKLWPPNEDTALASLTITNQANTNTFMTGSLPINRTAVTGDNKIIIEKIGVDMKIVEGTNEKVSLNLGAWHLPYTSSPDLGGNTVITAHRYKYRPPSKETFYLLDKLAIGDTFTVNWNGLQYKYQVSETKVVNPTDIFVLNPTSNPQVTLITCTPLFTTKQRLIVVAQEIP
ncbi:MAG: sortase [Patescibacteria group bacterium]